MSLVEQGTVSKSEAEINVPEFPVALRGYERTQVDAYLKDLAIRATAERRRAEHAERASAQMRAELASLRNQPPPSFEHLGAEAARVLEHAGLSAKMLVEEARNRGQALEDEGEARAADVIARAERRAAELEAEAGETLAAAATERERILAEGAQAVEDARTQAEEEARAALAQATESAERMRDRAMSERAAMRAETERLREHRERMLDYLSRIHADLGGVLAEAVPADAELRASEDEAADGVADDLEVALDPVDVELDTEHSAAAYPSE